MNETTWTNPAPADPRDLLDRDAVLLNWQEAKLALEKAKVAEMDWRKYIVKRAFPNPEEGTNTAELGNGYELKAVIKYNYKLDADNEKIERGLDEIRKTGNQGAFIADRLVSWTPNFLVTEYRNLQAQADDGSEEAKKMLNIVNSFLTIDEGAPTLNIKEPKGNKK
jgi:hypothetical protein